MGKKAWYKAVYDNGKARRINASNISEAVEKARGGSSPVVRVYQL